MPRSTPSFIAREKPPEPPRLACSMTRSLAAQRARGALEVGVVLDLLGALVDDDDLVEDLEHRGVGGQVEQLVDAELRTVERRDADGEAARGGLLGLEAPARVLEHQLLVAGLQVEPVPAAVDERLELEVDDLGLGHVGVDVDRAWRAARAPWRSSGRPRSSRVPRTLSVETDRLELGPAAPVARGEGVEVRAEGEPLGGLGDGVAHGADPAEAGHAAVGLVGARHCRRRRLRGPCPTGGSRTRRRRNRTHHRGRGPGRRAPGPDA